MNEREIYVSIDIETDGQVPGLHSMIALGAVAIDHKGNELGRFYAKLKPLPDAHVHRETVEWWTSTPELVKMWEDLHTNADDPDRVIRRFDVWVNDLKARTGKTPVACAWKPGFDIAFVRYYAHRFVGRDMFGRSGSGLDIKTLTGIALGVPFSELQIAKVPREMTGSTREHSHDALEDAIEQANVMVNAFKRIKEDSFDLCAV